MPCPCIAAPLSALRADLLPRVLKPDGHGGGLQEATARVRQLPRGAHAAPIGGSQCIGRSSEDFEGGVVKGERCAMLKGRVGEDAVIVGLTYFVQLMDVLCELRIVILFRSIAS